MACASSAAADRPRPVVGRTNRKILAVRNLFRSNGERGRRPSPNQAKGQRRNVIPNFTGKSAERKEPSA